MLDGRGKMEETKEVRRKREDGRVFLFP